MKTNISNIVIYLFKKNTYSETKEFMSRIKLKLYLFYHCFSYYNSTYYFQIKIKQSFPP